MTTSDPANRNRLQDLLADRATQHLQAGEQDELRQLLDAHPDVDPWEMDMVATAIDLPVFEADPEPLPASLRANVQRDAIAWLAGEQGLQLRSQPDEAPNATIHRRPASGWPWLVAAACLVIALFAALPNAVSESPVEVYARLAAVTETMPWSDAVGGGVSGDVVWDNASQTGVMRFRGLAVNTPTRMQYQLWIFDAARSGLTDDSGTPFNAVDGGVFDVETVGQDVYVRIAAKLEVFEPELFAVTTEPPGGVVKHISDGDFKIILTAALPTSG
ncbi:MAG: hypothetical protein ACYTGR_13805 [Planctomycetota bacterium]|jgi:hypothetical protein